MRVVSLGFPLPNPQVDNHSIANAPSLFEYDACVIDPRSVSRQIESILAGSRELRTAEGTPLQAGASGAFHFGLGELLEQRRRELARLVENGGVIAVLTYPNVPHGGIAGLPGADRYFILPAPAAVQYRPPQLVAGEGRRIHSLDPSHPFSVYVDDLAGKLRYRAHWDLDAVPDFESVGTVIAKSDGGAVAAVEFRLGAGRVVFLPAPHGEPKGAARRPFTDALLESIGRALEQPSGERPPVWVRHFDLPKLDQASATLQTAETTFAEAESSLVEARALQTEAAKYHGLLWREGKHSFEPLVRDAFRQLGFTVATDTSRPAELRDGDEIALLEVDASTKTVRERSYLSLQRRIEEDFLRSGVRRKGVIVVNGERLVSPARRDAPYTETLANACLNFGYALITAESLFSLVAYSLEAAAGRSENEESDDVVAETLAAMRETILDTEGLLAVEESDEPDSEGAEPDETQPDETSAATGASPNGATGDTDSSGTADDTKAGEATVDDDASDETATVTATSDSGGADRENGD